MARNLFLLTLLFTEAVADDCGLYLAKSSVSSSGDFKLGVYAGKEILKNEVIGEPDIAIQTYNLAGSNRPSIDNTDGPLAKYVSFTEELLWVPDATGGKFDTFDGRVVSQLPGAGTVGEFNMKLVNADWYHKPAYFRTSIGEVPGVAHPNRGAVSNFYNITLRSSKDIAAGSEIFIDFGENWADEAEDEEAEELQKIDYDRLDQVVDQVLGFMDRWKEALDTPAKRKEIYDFITHDILAAAAGPTKGPKLTKLLPNTPDELEKIKQAGGALQYSEPSAVRSKEWLSEHGMCMDGLEVKASTIEGIGRGAFAKRSFAAGEMIAPVPLIHYPGIEAMTMYDTHQQENPEDEEMMWVRKSQEARGKQLALNYCYGHPDSTMLLLPAGTATHAINHSPDDANAKLMWSNHEGQSDAWFDQTPEELMGSDFERIGLIMEIVATKDITAGEEVFLDYGSEWQAAWDAHVKIWEKKQGEGVVPKTWPLRATELLKEHESKPFKTREELEENPYPQGVRQMCFLVIKSQTDEDVKLWAHAADEKTWKADHLYNCEVTEVMPLEGGSWNYTVSWINKHGEETLVGKVPHSAIVFQDDMNNADELNAHAFRHFIGIPDDVFPQGKWRNRA